MVCVFAPAADDRGGLEVGSLAGVPDPQFPMVLVQRLARLLRVDLVAVAECSGTGRMRVLAGCFDGLPLEDLDYGNRFSPCGEVIRTARPLLLAGGLQQRFPEDRMLLAEDFESYAGLPLLLPDGSVAGVLHAAWRRAAGEAFVERARAAMQPYANRLAEGIVTRRRDEVTAALARGPGTRGPQAALRWLAARLQAASGARGVLIATALDDRQAGAPAQIGPPSRVVACCLDGAALRNAEGSALPWEPAVSPAGSGAWPADLSLPEVLRAGAADFAGAAPLAWSRSLPLRDRTGRLAGGIVLFNPEPLAVQAAGLFDIFAARILRELRCLQAQTVRRQRRRARQQAEKCASLAQLAGGIAGDASSAMASLNRHADLARELLAEQQGDAAAAAKVRRLEQGLRDCAGLLRPLLIYAQAPLGDARGGCDLNAVAQEAARASGAAAALDLSVRPLPVPGDAAQLRQLAQNLLENAADAAGGIQGSPVMIATRLADPSQAERLAMLQGSSLPPGPCAVLEVRDTGMGMDRQTLSRIFEPYFSCRPGRRGRGLGLAAVPGILRRHHGAAAVDSAPGAGTRFCVYLPLERPAAVAVRTGLAAVAGPILVVDDEGAVCRAVAGLLRLRGRAVALAGSHEAAVAAAQDSGPLGAAVIDMNLPGACGWETLAALRALQPGLPCVMMSGFPVSAAAAGYPQLSGVKILQKPFCKEELYRAVLI